MKTGTSFLLEFCWSCGTVRAILQWPCPARQDIMKQQSTSRAKGRHTITQSIVAASASMVAPVGWWVHRPRLAYLAWRVSPASRAHLKPTTNFLESILNKKGASKSPDPRRWWGTPAWRHSAGWWAPWPGRHIRIDECLCRIFKI